MECGADGAWRMPEESRAETVFTVCRATTWHIGRVEEKAGAVRVQETGSLEPEVHQDLIRERIGDRENPQENYDSNRYRGSQHCTSTATPSLCVPSAQVAGKTRMKDAIIFKCLESPNLLRALLRCFHTP